MLQFIYLPLLASILLLYFKFADQFNITDKPNHRSSHQRITIRGGGIIIPIAFLIEYFFGGFEFSYFILGLFLISLVSFVDDILPLSNKIRLLIHLISVSLLFYQINLFFYPWWMILCSYVVMIGAINAYNFMDGINGITGGYSLIAIASLWIVNERVTFVDREWIVLAFLVLLVFNYFNFRKEARCFAGDVGSISIAFVILFFILSLVVRTGELCYFGFLVLYGVDTVTTIIFRIVRRENIFEAHRSHFYQHLVNVKKWPHLGVSTLYMSLQLIVNLLIIYYEMDGLLFVFLSILFGLSYVGIRFKVEGKNALITSKKQKIS